MHEPKRHHEAKTKRLDHYPWPDHWTRAQKRACVQACKRAKKKGFKPNTPAWDAELAGAGFNKRQPVDPVQHLADELAAHKEPAEPTELEVLNGLIDAIPGEEAIVAIDDIHRAGK